jgi:hypothetical protein
MVNVEEVGTVEEKGEGRKEEKEKKWKEKRENIGDEKVKWNQRGLSKLKFQQNGKRRQVTKKRKRKKT